MSAAVKPAQEEPVQVLRQRSGTRPEVRLLRADDRQVVVKDYGGGGRMLKLLGLCLLPRERRAYQRLHSLAGIPTCVGGTRYTISVEYRQSVAAHAAGPELLTPWFFQRLRALIDEMHACGVAHGDLKRLDNIRVTPDGEPVIIDFSTAFLSGSSPTSALVMPHLMDEDIRAIYKIKRRRAPHLLTAEEERFLDGTTWRAQMIRRLIEAVRKPVKRLAHREHDGGM